MNAHNFSLVTPIQVKPMLTSLVRRARSDEVTFIMFAHSENDHFSLALLSALRERILSGEFFREAIALLPGVFLDPQASRPSDICPKALLCVILARLNEYAYACMHSRELYVTLMNPCLPFFDDGTTAVF